jgi:hypothetical protein
MGRIKDLIIELQNEYGQELENMPDDFSMDDYLKLKAGEITPVPSSYARDNFSFVEKKSYEETE